MTADTPKEREVIAICGLCNLPIYEGDNWHETECAICEACWDNCDDDVPDIPGE